MKFKSISATDKISGWNVKNIQFNPMLTLLVGASGVGKTRILNLINRLCLTAKGYSTNGFQWIVEFVQSGRNYMWEGEFELRNEFTMTVPELKENRFVLVREQITENGQIIVSRSGGSFTFHGKELVKLDNTKSAVELLKEEPIIKPIYMGFSRCFYWIITDNSLKVSPFIDKTQQRFVTSSQIKALGHLSPLERLFLLIAVFIYIDDFQFIAFQAIPDISIR